MVSGSGCVERPRAEEVGVADRVQVEPVSEVDWSIIRMNQSGTGPGPPFVVPTASPYKRLFLVQFNILKEILTDLMT